MFRCFAFRIRTISSSWRHFTKQLDDAQRVFDEMLDRNTITWTSLIHGYSRVHGVKSVTRITLHLHKSHEEFNEHTCSVILRACESPDKRICGE
ncbi:unnamed protein product [Camellia sinensis]